MNQAPAKGPHAAAPEASAIPKGRGVANILVQFLRESQEKEVEVSQKVQCLASLGDVVQLDSLLYTQWGKKT